MNIHDQRKEISYTGFTVDKGVWFGAGLKEKVKSRILKLRINMVDEQIIYDNWSWMPAARHYGAQQPPKFQWPSAFKQVHLACWSFRLFQGTCQVPPSFRYVV